MYAGQPLNGLYCDLPAQYSSVLPANLRGALPPSGSPEFVTSISVNNNLLYLWTMKPDFVTPSNSTLSGPTNLAVGYFTASATTAPQLNSTEQVDLVNDRQMMQLQYRHIGNVESLWATHTVDSSGVNGIRWYEVRDPNGSPYIYQQGAYQPDSNYRFMPSLAVDKLGDIAVGYSVSSASMYPAIRYAGRLAGDTLNTLGQGETSLIEGAGSQYNGYGRWGDYTAMTVDPTDDCTFWYTNEYYAVTGSNWQTCIGSFRFPGCTGATSVVSGTVTDALLGTPLSATLSINGSADGPVTTNPATGFYSVTLSPGVTYNFSVTAQVGGYNVTTATIGPLNGNSTYNFTLYADTAVCNALGYAFAGGISENFDSAPTPALPQAWATSVVTMSSSTDVTPTWFLNPGTRYPSGYPSHSNPNLVLFNSYSSDAGDSARLYRRSATDMTSVSDTDLTLWMFNDSGYASDNDNVQVQVSTDGGTTWADVGAPLSRPDASTGWNQYTISLAAYSGVAQLMLGFLGNSAWGNDVHLDDIALGSPLGCSPLGFHTRAFIPIVMH
ncbi:MAG: carboxypeptidase-like regulatory domain-containing protein [Chloroflexi bacterium]|nr:carboxypeptidase-like regulatory domain-containing protein [Chloroflexota bacterium]MCL5275271.1 carboxypeptidase-like regulatory domain-containing protein [Chloroflexota bacterium]